MDGKKTEQVITIQKRGKLLKLLRASSLMLLPLALLGFFLTKASLPSMLFLGVALLYFAAIKVWVWWEHE